MQDEILRGVCRFLSLGERVIALKGNKPFIERLGTNSNYFAKKMKANKAKTTYFKSTEK